MKVDPILAALEVGTQVLQDIRRGLAERVRRGLAADAQEIKGLPAYLAPPSPTTEGQAIVLDTGGTNMRASLVVLDGDGGHEVRHRRQRELPSGRGGAPLSAAAFFDPQAALIREVLDRARDAPRTLPVGYVFSYPTRRHADLDATLLRWTKGVQVSGVEGTQVGAGLRRALQAQDVAPRAVHVLNDTVSALMGGAYTHGRAHREISDWVGKIVGTGTNMAIAADRALLSKVAASDWRAPKMVVNLESGAADIGGLTPWDRAVDAADRPGEQRLEKTVGGHYLPHIFGQICRDTGIEVPGFDPAKGSGQLVAFQDAPETLDDTLAFAKAISAKLIQRAARVQAAAAAAVIDVLQPEGKVGFLIEGTLFWKATGFAARYQDTLAELGCADKIVVLQMEHANEVGAACAALAPHGEI